MTDFSFKFLFNSRYREYCNLGKQALRIYVWKIDETLESHGSNMDSQNVISARNAHLFGNGSFRKLSRSP